MNIQTDMIKRWRNLSFTSLARSTFLRCTLKSRVTKSSYSSVNSVQILPSPSIRSSTIQIEFGTARWTADRSEYMNTLPCHIRNSTWACSWHWLFKVTLPSSVTELSRGHWLRRRLRVTRENLGVEMSSKPTPVHSYRFQWRQIEFPEQSWWDLLAELTLGAVRIERLSAKMDIFFTRTKLVNIRSVVLSNHIMWKLCVMDQLFR